MKGNRKEKERRKNEWWKANRMALRTKNENMKRTGRNKERKEYKKFKSCSFYLLYQIYCIYIALQFNWNLGLQKIEKTVDGRIPIWLSFARGQIFIYFTTVDLTLCLYFYRKFPDLFTWFKVFLGYKENQPIDPVTGFKDRGTGGELAHLEIGTSKSWISRSKFEASDK